ncbi:hypothetical protein AMJ44_13020 [candidate division WOR-1 bacterium DG_54_3]|uniref:SLH domain-containing protein n=1 Tax=candidate division WOR-1 bacterium DG_54_3 TaxID=1703775 RepID=A0A0S7XPA7_UNCSA|nr:MAG: hypothetical protein AMJ44_13020 [candidate division WOR-1 bacterium DG_54_3]
MIKRFLILTLLYCCAVIPALATDGLSLDPSQTLFTARQLGMGGVSVAFSDDANGVFSNPAGLTEIEFPQLVGASRKLILDETQYTLVGWAVPTDWGIFGMGFTSMNTGGSLPTKRDPATNRIMVDPSREATSYDNSVLAFSYSRRLRENLSIGGNLKLFNQSLGGDLHSKANATGIGLCAAYKPLTWLSLGANLQNALEGNLSWDGGSSDKIGGFYKLGCKINILGSSEEAWRPHSQSLYGGLDIDIPHSTLSSTNYHLGVEYFPLEKIALRGGFNLDQNGTGLTLGVGLINGGFRFDYAFVERPGLPCDTPHYFSLSYIGERVVTVSRKLKTKEPYIKFSQPRDRLITDQEKIAISAEARARRILEQTTTWTVTAISETKEVKEVDEIEDLRPVYANGIKIDQVGSVELSSSLGMGRNVFEIMGFTTPEVMTGKISPEVFSGSGEVKVLRFKPFTDTPMTHWAIEPIALSITLGLVKGYPDKTFKPEKGITRAELVTLLVRTMPVKLEEADFPPFIDVPTKHWAAKYIAYGSKQKLITGYPDGTFKPNAVLNRAEGVTILARYSGFTEEVQTTAPFPDLQPDYWANKYIWPAKKSGLLEYLVGKDFEPTTPFTRAEAAEVLYRTPQVQRGVDQFWETGMVSAQ